MHPNLARLVDLAGMAIESEDRQILEATAANPTAKLRRGGGILRFNNERFYQFIVAKSLLSMPYKVVVEVDFHDLVLEEPDTGKRFAVVEMKRWMSASGERELPGIRTDMFKKLQKASATHKLMLLFSANPPGQMHEQINWLLAKLNLPLDRWSSYCFTTSDQNNAAVEFWIAGFEFM